MPGSEVHLRLQVVLLFALAVLAVHVIGILLSFKIHPLFMLGGAFLLTAPYALSLTPGFGVFKVARIYVTVLMGVMGLLVVLQNRPNLGIATAAYATFVLLYVSGAGWSEHPGAGFLYKGLFGLLAWSGVVLGVSIASFKDLAVLSRVVTLCASVWVISILGSALQHIGGAARLDAFGINANAIGASSALFLPFCLFAGFYDTSKTVQLAAKIVSVMVAVSVPLTGSRAATGIELIIICIMLRPFVRNPIRVLSIVALTLIAGTVLTLIISPKVTERLLSLTNTREEIWTTAGELIRRSPIIGVGWSSGRGLNGAELVNHHSIYLQVMVELGVVGVGVMIVTFGIISRRLIQVVRMARSIGGYQHATGFCSSLFISILAGGVFEVGAMLGTTPNAFLLGVSVGFLDSLYSLVRQDREIQVATPQPELAYAYQ